MADNKLTVWRSVNISRFVHTHTHRVGGGGGGTQAHICIEVFSCHVGNFQHEGFPSWLINITASTHCFVRKLR